MRISICQFNPTIGALEENTAKIIDAIKTAKEDESELIVFPELAISGYPPEDVLLRDGFVERCEEKLREIVQTTTGISAIIGLPRKAPQDGHDKPFFNSAAVCVNGKIIGFQDKVLLPTYDVFDERRYFRPGTSGNTWSLCGKVVALTICEDIWCTSSMLPKTKYPQDPLTLFEKQQIDLLINISSSPYHLGKISLRNQIAKDAAKRLNCPLVLCNQIGAQDGILFDGSSVVINEDGELAVMAPSFVEKQLVVDMNALNVKEFPAFLPAKELFLALVMGVRDYFHKQGFTKACFGMSGGIDSSVVACIATEALGPKNVLGVLLPSRFTSSESTEDALLVAKKLGIKTVELSIEPLFETALSTLKPYSQDKPFAITEENLQSRLRGLLLMAFSNREGYLVLNTSNKSELAVGYTTLYGDSIGAIAVIGDLLKHQVYTLAKSLSSEFGWIPQRVLDKIPTAELRPNQKDSDTIPEYPVLDPIVEAYVVRELSVEEIAKKLSVPLAFVQEIAKKIEAAEYKRRQIPFALRISEKAFSVGRRVPIVHK